RLLKIVRERLGHRIALAVEGAKIGLSDAEMADLPLAFVEARLCAQATQAQFSKVIAEKAERLTQVASSCVATAGVSAGRIHTVFLTGGSSRVPAVRAAISRAVPDARIATGSDLLSVALGLTRQAARQFA